MAWLILIGFLLFTTIVYVYLQKLVMKLPHKIWHFVPIIFLGVLTPESVKLKRAESAKG